MKEAQNVKKEKVNLAETAPEIKLPKRKKDDNQVEKVLNIKQMNQKLKSTS